MTAKRVQSSSNIGPVIDEAEWVIRQQKHTERLGLVVNAHQQRILMGEKHPIVDFLFEYYHFKPAKLMAWSPGIGATLAGDKALVFLDNKHYCKSATGVYVNPDSFPDKRRVGLNWVINLLIATQSRKPFFGCFGLHEWCMVYEEKDIRHQHLPLRLSHSKIRDLVEHSSVQCTHYDAFRFYSDSAKTFNREQLNRNDMNQQEQPGCLHSNMDLYRWAYKFSPWLASELIAEAFLLALKIRETDMRASPYDVSHYTEHAPIKIECRKGKEEYAALQRQYFDEAKILRAKLIYKLKQLKIQIGAHEKHDSL